MPKHALTWRNSMLQACEECRKAKARCDHEIPTCHRCAQRRVTCIYHPAPMSRQTRSRLAVNNGLNSHNSDLEQTYQASGNSSQSASVIQTPLPNILAPPPQRSLFNRSVVGHVTTQFNAVFLENQEKFGFSSMLSPTMGKSMEKDTAFERNKDSPSSINDTKVQLGIDILRRFPTLRTQQAIWTF